MNNQNAKLEQDSSIINFIKWVTTCFAYIIWVYVFITALFAAFGVAAASLKLLVDLFK